MSKYRAYLTDDGSIGLFSGDVNDVFHSRYGALSEAYEKFVEPSNYMEYLEKNKVLNVLDICYGIGYNSKALINTVLKNANSNLLNNYIVSLYTNNTNIEKLFKKPVSIYSDNISIKKNEDLPPTSILSENFPKGDVSLKDVQLNYNDNIFNSKERTAIVADNLSTNRLYKINIDALEYEKDFVYLSPFIKNLCYREEYKLLCETNYIIYKFLSEQFSNDFFDFIKNNQFINEKSKFFDSKFISMVKNKPKRGCEYTLSGNLSALLHNIYYRYVSKQPLAQNTSLINKDYQNLSKRAVSSFKEYEFSFDIKFHTEDARITIQKLNKKYDIIFLDAFTPTKLPTLWTIDFFKKLFNLISDDGVLLTYSNSARIRNALRHAGFYIGKIQLNTGEYTGTIASKNKSKIVSPLSPKEEGLLDTKSGIYYKDEALNSPPQDILDRLDKEIQTSSLISSSQYLKGVNHEI